MFIPPYDLKRQVPGISFLCVFIILHRRNACKRNLPFQEILCMMSNHYVNCIMFTDVSGVRYERG